MGKGLIKKSKKSGAELMMSDAQLTKLKNKIYQVPFLFGWTREFQYRKKLSRVDRVADVYYRDPITKKRFRSSSEIEGYLAENTHSKLKPKHFTFYCGLLHPADQSKEKIIGQLCTSLQNVNDKTKTLEGNALESKSTTNNTTVANNDSNVIPSGEDRTMKGSKQANEIPTTKNEMNESAAIQCPQKEPPSTVSRSPQGHAIMNSAMKHILKYLKVHELLVAARVCMEWNQIAMNLWIDANVNDIVVKDWNKIIDTLVRQNYFVLDISRTKIPENRNERKQYWQEFIEALANAHQINVLKIKKCPPHIVRTIFVALPQLKIFNATSICNLQDDKKTDDETHEGEKVITISISYGFEYKCLSLEFLDNMKNLTELRLTGQNSLTILECPPSLAHLIHLKVFTLTSVKQFCTGICDTLLTLTTDLQHFGIGDCNAFDGDLTKVIARLVNLISLRLENLAGDCVIYSLYDFHALKGLKTLKSLEFVKVELE